MTDEEHADGFRALFRTEDGVEVVVRDATRMELARRILANRDPISAMALRLLLAFLHPSFAEHRAAFDLDSIEVFAERTADQGDFSLRYLFSEDARDLGSTYFDVFFNASPPPAAPYWPFRFAIGFH